MQEQITTIYCLCDDFLRAWGHQDDPQAQMTTAEVMTVALVAPTFFGGNQNISRLFLHEHGYIKDMLSKKRHALQKPLHSATTCHPRGALAGPVPLAWPSTSEDEPWPRVHRRQHASSCL